MPEGAGVMREGRSRVLTGWLFVAAAALLWAGRVLMPHQLGFFFQPADFEALSPVLRPWLWAYRAHLFGWMAAVLAFVAFAATVREVSHRVLIWPGVAVASGGFFVTALGEAFYYHFGVWGTLALQGQGEAAVAEFVESLRVATEYVTCLVRFGRVFTGLGLVVVGWGLLSSRLLPWWIGAAAAGLGVAAMAVTMGFPDDLDWFAPVFHLQALWLAAAGVAVLRRRSA